VPAGGSRRPASAESLAGREHYIRMQGREVFKNAVAAMTRSAEEVLQKAGRSIDEVACVIPHQANARILKAVGQRLGVGPDRLYMNVERYGNTSAASVILAIDEASRAGRFKPGDLILTVVFGAGFTWGAMLIEWGK
jgi:3-oxoacyl-[acyl-carrier-protein] synthase-3